MDIHLAFETKLTVLRHPAIDRRCGKNLAGGELWSGTLENAELHHATHNPQPTCGIEIVGSQLWEILLRRMTWGKLNLELQKSIFQTLEMKILQHFQKRGKFSISLNLEVR